MHMLNAASVLPMERHRGVHHRIPWVAATIGILYYGLRAYAICVGYGSVRVLGLRRALDLDQTIVIDRV